MRRTFDCGIALLALLAAGIFGRTDRVAAAEFGKTRKMIAATSQVPSALVPRDTAQAPAL